MNDRRHTILLVEDHDSFALTLETVLSTDPRVEVVDRACDGRAGVELALLHQPDVVLMDIYMPTLDGVAATRELAELLPATAVVILSSSDQPADVERAFDAGAVAFLPKDASLPEIVATVVAASERSEPDLGAGTKTRELRLPARQAMARLCL